MAKGSRNPSKASQFQPGQSGNPGGRPAYKAFTEALRRALKINKDTGESKELDEIAKELIIAAKDGDIHAIREIADRLEGKVPQGIVGHDGGAVEVVHTFKSSI